jgi:hypothetical protein
MSLGNQFRIDELIKSGSAAISSKDKLTGNHIFVNNKAETITTGTYVHTKGERDGETSGYVERPIYDEDQLRKAINIEVNELIPASRKLGPDVVPRRVYTNLEELYSQSLDDNRELRITNSELASQVESLKTEVSSLKTQLDSEALLRSNAENQLEMAEERYTSTLIDFQNSLSKGIKEGIERVSLNAQVEGLQAQKEILVTQIKEQEEQTAAAVVLSGRIFEQALNSGWKIPDANVSNDGRRGIFVESTNDNSKKFPNGRKVIFYNFDESAEAIFTLSTSESWFLYPRTFKVPPREGTRAGATTVDFGFRAKGRTGSRNSWDDNILNVTTSTGDNLSLYIGYKKEVKRNDTWGSVNYTVQEGQG